MPDAVLDSQILLAQLEFLYSVEPEAALDKLRGIAEKGAVQAQVALGVLLAAKSNSRFFNPDEALHFFQQAAKRNSHDALIGQAACIIENQDVFGDRPELLKNAWDDIEALVIAQNPAATYYKAVFMLNSGGAGRDREQALQLLDELAALHAHIPDYSADNRNFTPGMVLPAQCFAKEVVLSNYLLGSWYVDRHEYETARGYLQRKTQRNHAPSMVLLESL